MVRQALPKAVPGMHLTRRRGPPRGSERFVHAAIRPMERGIGIVREGPRRRSRHTLVTSVWSRCTSEFAQRPTAGFSTREGEIMIVAPPTGCSSWRREAARLSWTTRCRKPGDADWRRCVGLREGGCVGPTTVTALPTALPSTNETGRAPAM